MISSFEAGEIQIFNLCLDFTPIPKVIVKSRRKSAVVNQKGEFLIYGQISFFS